VTLVLADVDAAGRERIRHGLAETGSSVHFAPLNDAPEELLASAEVIVGWRPSAHHLEVARSLRLFVTPAAGVQTLVPLFRALAQTRQPPMLANSHANAPLVAQHVVALLLAAASGIVAHDRWMRAGRWRLGDAQHATRPLRQLVIGLLGYGPINREVERLLEPFGCRFAILRSGHDNGARLEFFASADAVIVAAPLTEETRGIVGAAELAALGPSGLLVNVGRGALVDEDALYAALVSRRLAGAALDVWYDYDPLPDHEGRRYPYTRPFHELDNVVLSPHRAASPHTDASRWDDVMSIVRRYYRGEPLELVDLNRGY
jgi:phosphoglycerate dehydrogenase-like enzyme